MSMNNCPDDVFLITKHSVTKFGTVMHQYELECHMEKNGSVLKTRSQWGLIYDQLNFAAIRNFCVSQFLSVIRFLLFVTDLPRKACSINW